MDDRQWNVQKQHPAGECSVKKVFLEILQNSRERDSGTGVFFCEFCEIS